MTTSCRSPSSRPPAPPAAVWPWVVWLTGHPRPGARPGTADPTPPDLAQPPRDLKAGDVMDGGGYVVERVGAPYSLVLADRGTDATTSCSVVLRDTGGGTRLILRTRTRGEPTVRGAAHVAMMDVGDFVAMRRQLLTIKARAESAG
ncbi:hypothetical protein ACFFV7_27180 [Nonomuraea spiralis]|uniref:Uncharacterized protein n=1 Tax=Nonomuraea spiralis TaxID=46182 RepID=A0ABV5ILU4_9ACTN|nr:hypothetical protein [Nonomuraea spiralis]